MKSFAGEAFFIWWRMPSSVSTMYCCPSSEIVYLSSAVVEPMKSASARMGASHSGWAMTFALG
jgi:hypothetical protein